LRFNFVTSRFVFFIMWINDVFYYSVGMLKAIAFNYESLYTDAPDGALFYIAESKADFDRALDAIGRGKWRGLTNDNFGSYRYFGRQQQIVIADILDIKDYKLEGYGFYEIPQLRGQAYSKMMVFLNGCYVK
jgi:hypothetical protein